jgi:hypothetical protein
MGSTSTRVTEKDTPASGSPEYLSRCVRVLGGIMEGARKHEMKGAGHCILATKMWDGDVQKAVGYRGTFGVRSGVSCEKLLQQVS